MYGEALTLYSFALKNPSVICIRISRQSANSASCSMSICYSAVSLPGLFCSEPIRFSIGDQSHSFSSHSLGVNLLVSTSPASR